MKRPILFGALAALTLMLATALPVSAGHSWGGYHWARASAPFTLRLGDNVTAAWDSYLTESETYWSTSQIVVDVVAGATTNLKRCTAAAGRVEVCNAKYGNNGWLGIAGISVSGGHITSGYVKLNDSYFVTATYNKPEWRRMVMCQEIAHAFGLDHQDVNFNNANLGSCMDYTGNPLGPPSNELPNSHDYDQIASIYSHFDTGATPPSGGQGKKPANHSRVDRVDAKGNGTVTWIFWKS